VAGVSTQDVVEVSEGLTGAGQQGGLNADGLLSKLTALLVDAPSGLTFVYRALDTVVERWKLSDAVLVLDLVGGGRQAFRAGRRPLDGPWAGPLAASAGRGLYTDPIILQPEVNEGIVGLCEIGLRLDVLDHDATHDPLTGLLNRRSFDGLLEQALARSRRYGWSFSLVMLDLNGFKALNDRHGHAAGDEVLQRIGSVLRSSMRAGDVAARIGGDEFAVLLSRSEDSAGQLLAARVTSLVNRELSWASVAFAVGVASAPTESIDALELSRLADARLYEAKAG
jgi:diguanylate cyclase (GGDEF)-like protein